MSSPLPSNSASTALVTIGAAATAVGGLGVGFRAAGLGYFAQSAGALLLGITLLGLGLHLAARGRRDVFAGLRATPIRVSDGVPVARAPVARVPFAPMPTPARVRVQAHVLPPLAIPPAGGTTHRG